MHMNSSLDLYFVVTRRRNSNGELINGRWYGISGWQNGVKGPLVESEARKISGSTGAEIVPVELEDVDELVRTAFRKAEVPLPEELVPKDEDADAEEVSDSVEDVVESDSAAEEDEARESEGDEDLPEFPGYQKAIELMSEKDFDWKDAGGGRAEGNVRDAWQAFVKKVAKAKK